MIRILIGILFACGCELSHRPFAGAIVEMTLTSVPASAPGTHLELWARNPYNDTVRVSGIFDYTDSNNRTTRLFPYGFAVRPAITMDDPCMIDRAGHLLVTASAYRDTAVQGISQSAEEQAEQVRARIGQLTSLSSCDGSGLDPSYHCGHANGTLLGLIAYETVDAQGAVTAVAPPPLRTCETTMNEPGCLSFEADPTVRLAACRAYWDSSPLAYTPNPLQLTAPAHGLLYGETTFVTTTPPSVFDSIRIDSNVKLKGIQELWITAEPADAVDPARRGPALLQGVPGPGGLGIVHIDLSPPVGSTVVATGTAALEVELDDYPIRF